MKQKPPPFLEENHQFYNKQLIFLLSGFRDRIPWTYLSDYNIELISLLLFRWHILRLISQQLIPRNTFLCEFRNLFLLHLAQTMNILYLKHLMCSQFTIVEFHQNPVFQIFSDLRQFSFIFQTCTHSISEILPCSN